MIKKDKKLKGNKMSEIIIEDANPVPVSGMSMGATIVDWLETPHFWLGQTSPCIGGGILWVTGCDGVRNDSPVKQGICVWYQLMGRAVVDLVTLAVPVLGAIALALKAFNAAFSFSVLGFSVLPLSLYGAIAVGVAIILVWLLDGSRVRKESTLQ